MRLIVISTKLQKKEKLTILSDLEAFAFYRLPDFDDGQRLTYFAYLDKEWELITKCPTPNEQIVCALQLGYFKAKQTFFPLHKVHKHDFDFILSQYFSNPILDLSNITKHEYYLQRKAICKLFGYKPWSSNLLSLLNNRAKLSRPSAKRRNLV